MPWCDTCDRLVDDEDLGADGSCPTCGTDLADPPRQPIPLRLKLLGVATAGYLIWRIVQGVQWLSHHA